MRPLKVISIIALFSTVVSCAHHRDVRPGADGIHRVSFPTDNKDGGIRKAISEANDYCKTVGKKAYFIDEKAEYSGDMDEEDYKTGKTLTKVAKVAGGATWVFGGEKESNLGGIAGLGGIVGDAALGDGYTVSMTFNCK